jgi:ABC-2 type transport system permease protein
VASVHPSDAAASGLTPGGLEGGGVETLRLLYGAALAFLHRGVATYVSYRAKLFLGLASLAVSVVTFALVGRVVEAAGSGFADAYGTDYASFAVLGVTVHTVAGAGLGCFRSALRREQLQGTLEVLLTTRTPFPAIVLLSGMSELALIAAGGAALLVASRFLIGVTLDLTPLSLAAIVIYALFMSGLGIASAGCILVSKEGEPVSWLFGAASALLGGVYFPIDLMPGWAARAALALPTTHALALVRRSSAGATHGIPLSTSLVLLSSAAILSLVTGFFVLRWGFRTARRRGTLGEY